MATIEVGAASTWVSHGIETSKFFGTLLGVEVEPFDGEFEAENQLTRVPDGFAGEDWDFVAVHPAASDALIDGADAVIAKGTPLIVMDTRLIQDPEAFAAYGHLTYLEPDNIYMGSTVATELFKAIGGEGEVIHTQGQLGSHRRPGPRRGLQAGRRQLSGHHGRRRNAGRLAGRRGRHPLAGPPQRYPNVVGGFFHSDDMALAARSVVESAGMQDQVKIVGVDGLKNACEAIIAGQHDSRRSSTRPGASTVARSGPVTSTSPARTTRRAGCRSSSAPTVARSPWTTRLATSGWATTSSTRPPRSGGEGSGRLEMPDETQRIGAERVRSISRRTSRFPDELLA